MNTTEQEQLYRVVLEAQKELDIASTTLAEARRMYLSSICSCDHRDVGMHKDACPLNCSGIIIAREPASRHKSRSETRYHKKPV